MIVGGTSLLAATMLFAAVFSYLAAAFGYPAVLDRPADDVLPALLALGTRGRIVWLVYGLIPVLLVRPLLASRKPHARRRPDSVQPSCGSPLSARWR